MNCNDLIRRLLSNLTDHELENLVAVGERKKPVPVPRNLKKPVNGVHNSIYQQPRRPIPTPRKSVKTLVKEHENNIITPPIKFRDKPIPAPRQKNAVFY